MSYDSVRYDSKYLGSKEQHEVKMKLLYMQGETLKCAINKLQFDFDMWVPQYGECKNVFWDVMPYSFGRRKCQVSSILMMWATESSDRLVST